MENDGVKVVNVKKSGASWLSALIIGICVVLSCAALSIGLSSFHSVEKHTIGATGSASVDFESDLITWSGSFNVHADTSQEAYKKLKKDAETVREYLIDHGMKEGDEFELGSVDISKRTKDIYDVNGNWVGTEPDGYDLYQNVKISSSQIDTVESISRDISALLDKGIEFTSDSPQYYYTKLDSLKLDLIEKATKNARERIQIIADNSDAQVGKLVNSNLGVFQITATNSGTGDYSYDGAFDTYSRNKTATITVRLEYELK